MDRMLVGLEGERTEVIGLVVSMLGEALGPDSRNGGNRRGMDMGRGVPDWDSDDYGYDSEEEDDEDEDEDSEEEDSQNDSEEEEEDGSSAWESSDSGGSLPPPTTRIAPRRSASTTTGSSNPLRRPVHPRLAATARAHPLPTSTPASRERMLHDNESEDDDELPELEGIDSDSDSDVPPLHALVDEQNEAPLNPAFAALINRARIVTSEPQRVTGEELGMLMGMEREAVRRRRRRGEEDSEGSEEDNESEEDDDAMPGLEDISPPASDDESSPFTFPRRPLSSRPLAFDFSDDGDSSNEDEDQGLNVFVDHHRPMNVEEEALRRDVHDSLGRAFGAFGFGLGGSNSDSEEEDQEPNVFVDHHRPMTVEEQALRRDVHQSLGRAFGGAFGLGGASSDGED